ncbi:MAG: succinate dehydrogenase, cytochrome b556 subunit [Alphaproteobacteria bacterium]|nr:succinate dehydrogenase, cytochrome b556 subunit [Alphaproteobacteria bacterium]
MPDVGMKNSRPLSPHIQIYKPIMTMVMSILHRITGAALYFRHDPGRLVAGVRGSGTGLFRIRERIFGSFLGRLVLFGFTWALIHHMLGGLRHFIWDMGYGFGTEAREWLARATIIGSVAVTILLWVIGYAVR